MTLREFLKMFKYDKDESYMVKITKEDSDNTFEITDTQEIMLYADWYITNIFFASWRFEIFIKEQL